MSRYVALLRGINLGSHNRIKMSELTTAFESAGFTNVKTYLQSGNIAFDTNSKAGLDETIHSLIQSEFKLDVPVVTRTSSEIKAIIDAQPFKSNAAGWHVTFLASIPTGSDVDTDVQTNGDDEWQLVGRNVYLHIPGNYSDSRLTNAYFERNLGVPATTRNWKTVLALTSL